MKKKTILGLILIISGIIIFMIPISLQLYNKYQQAQMIQAIKDQIADNIQNQNNQSSSPDPSASASTTINQPSDQFSNLELETSRTEEPSTLDTQSQTVKEILQYQKVIGIIEIKQLDIIFPIVEGADRANIRAAIGHIKDTADLGSQGNCVLAGHRGGIYGVFFKHIDQLDNKDVVKITDANGKEYQYQVYEQFVVEPNAMYVTDPIGDETTLTLVSCEDDGTKRLIVRCRLKE